MRVVARHAVAAAAGLFSIFNHCAQVLLNGKTLPWRLWSVFVGSAPPIVWTLSFKQAKRIPSSIRPPIHIDLLPGANTLLLSSIGVFLFTLSLIPLVRAVDGYGQRDKGNSSTRTRAFAISILLYPTVLKILDHLGILDLLAFGSYGALHFASPIVCAWWLWFFGSQGTACAFGWCLGIQNLCGLVTHLVFPNASPWFYDVYGSNPSVPDYSYPGNPAGLIRVDEILGTSIYAKAFGKSPVVFGAVPSLHAATSICCGLFVTRYSKGYRGLAFMWIYWSWMFWATMYLHHHFAIDLVIGTLYALVFFTLAHRIRLGPIDLAHERRGLSNGWQRLRWGTGLRGDGFLLLSPSVAGSAMMRSSSAESGEMEYGLGIETMEPEEMEGEGEEELGEKAWQRDLYVA